MDATLLPKLSLAVANQAVSVWNSVVATQIDLAVSRFENPQATATAIAANAGFAAPFESLFTVADTIGGQSATIRQLTSHSATVTAAIQAFRNKLQSPTSIVATDIASLTQVVEVYRKLKLLQEASEFFKNFVQTVLPTWYAAEKTFTVPPLKIQFLGNVSGSPFDPQASISGRVTYPAGFSVSVTGIFVTLEGPTQIPVPQIDWNLASFAGGVAAEATAVLSERLSALSLAFPIQIKSVALIKLPPPATLDVTVGFSNVLDFMPVGFDGIATLSPSGEVKVKDAAGQVTIPGPIFIGTTGFAFDSFKIGFAAVSKLLTFKSNIVPAGPTPNTIAFKLECVIKLTALQEGIGFNGSMVLGVAEMARLDQGQISAQIIKATMIMPGSSGVSPLGPKEVFDATLKFTLTKEGLKADGTVKLFSVVNCTGDAVILFDGKGTFTAKATALGLTLDVLFSHEAGFQNLRASAAAELSINLGKVRAGKASVQLDFFRQGAQAKVTATAKAFGLKFSDTFNLTEFSLADKILEWFKDQGNNFFEKLWDGAKEIAADLDPTNKNGALRKALAECDPFQNIQEAKDVVKHWVDVGSDTGEKIVEYVDDRVPKKPQDLDPTSWSLTDGLSLTQTQTLFGGFPGFEPDLRDIFNSELFRRSLLELTLKELRFTDRKRFFDSRVGDPFFAECRYDVVIDEIVGAFSDANQTLGKRETLNIAFAVMGSSQAQFRESKESESFSVWGALVFQLKKGQAPRVTLKLPRFADASSLGLYNVVYRGIKQAVLETWSDAIFVNTVNNVTGDPDPGPPPQPTIPHPIWKIRANVGNTDAGCEIIFITPGGPAEIAGLKVGDFITTAEGKPVGLVGGQLVTLASVFANSLFGKVSIEFRRVVSGQNVIQTIEMQLVHD